jgi:hypothetical protein
MLNFASTKDVSVFRSETADVGDMRLDVQSDEGGSVANKGASTNLREASSDSKQDLKGARLSALATGLRDSRRARLGGWVRSIEDCMSIVLEGNSVSVSHDGNFLCDHYEFINSLILSHFNGRICPRRCLLTYNAFSLIKHNKRTFHSM